MVENIFLKDQKPISFADYLYYNPNSRENLGAELPVMVYRMLEYSLKDELIKRYGKEEQVEIFGMPDVLPVNSSPNNSLIWTSHWTNLSVSFRTVCRN